MNNLTISTPPDEASGGIQQAPYDSGSGCTPSVSAALPAAAHPHLVSGIAEVPVQLTPQLRTGIPRLDRFFDGGFLCGQVSLIEGPAEFILFLTYRFAVSGVVSFERPVLFIDGGNTADPYGLASVCRRMHVDPKTVLSRIFIARAFTIYQLDSLFTQMVEERISTLNPAVVIVSAMNSMYLDPDVNWDEAKMIFQNDLRILNKLTEKYRLLSMVTNFGSHPSYHDMELQRALRKTAKSRISVKSKSKHKLRLVRNGTEWMDYRPLPPYQCSLDEFFQGGVLDG